MPYLGWFQPCRMVQAGSEQPFVFAEYLENVSGHARNTTLKSGDFFGDEVLLDEHRYSGTVLALQTTGCWSINRASLKQTLTAMKMKRRKQSSNVA